MALGSPPAKRTPREDPARQGLDQPFDLRPPRDRTSVGPMGVQALRMLEPRYGKKGLP